MTSSRRPPTFMPLMPSSQPWMTCPWPSGNWNGWPRAHEASNCSPVDHELPTYWTVANWPGLIAGPEPVTRSFLISFVGGSPDGVVISGFFLRSVGSLTAGACPDVAFGWAGAVVVDAGVVAA